MTERSIRRRPTETPSGVFLIVKPLEAKIGELIADGGVSDSNTRGCRQIT